MSGFEIPCDSSRSTSGLNQNWDDSVLKPADMTTEWNHQYWNHAAKRITEVLKEKVSAFHSKKKEPTVNSKKTLELFYAEAFTKIDTLLKATTTITDIKEVMPDEYVFAWTPMQETEFTRQVNLTLYSFLRPRDKDKKNCHHDAKSIILDYSKRMAAAPNYLKFTTDEESRLLATLPDINHSEKTYDNNKASFEALASNNQSLQKECNALGRELEAIRTQLSKLKKEHTQQQELLKKEKTEATRQEESHKRQMQEISEKNSKKLQSIAEANTKLQNQFSTLLQSFEQLEQKKQDLVFDLQTANAQGGSLLEQITLVKQQSEAARQELEKMDIAHNLSLESKDQEIKQLKSEVEKLNHEKNKLTKQASPSITVRSRFNGEKGQVHDNYEKVLSNNKNLKAEVAQLKEQLQQSQLKSSVVTATTSSIPSSRTTDETAKLSAEVTRLEAENEKLKAQIQTSSQLDVSAPSMNANIEQAWRQLEKENKEYKDKVKELETGLKESQKSATEMLENFQKRIEQLEKENKKLEESSNSTPKEILKDSSDSASKEALALSKYPTVPEGLSILANAKPDLSNLFNYASELTDTERSFELHWENLANVLNEKTGSNINHKEIAYNTGADYGGLSTFLTEWSGQEKATNLILAQSLFDCLEAKHSELAKEFYINIRTGKDSLRSK